MKLFPDISKETFPKRWMLVNIGSLVFVKELSIALAVLNRVHLWLVKIAYLVQQQGHTNNMDSEYLENYVWTYVHATDLDQEVGLWGI